MCLLTVQSLVGSQVCYHETNSEQSFGAFGTMSLPFIQKGGKSRMVVSELLSTSPGCPIDTDVPKMSNLYLIDDV